MLRRADKWTLNTHQITFLLVLLGSVNTLGQLTIIPATPPAVGQGETFKFSANIPVSWSCPGCAGTVDPDGTYHAPALVRAQQSYGGFQLLPNDHILNTRIDALPVNSSSANWIAGSGSNTVGYSVSAPVNYVTQSTPTQNMSFYYTPANNGPFEIPPYPDARIETGWFFAPFANYDRHFFAIDTGSGIFQEMYNYYSPGANSSCQNCTSQSGLRYSNTSYALPQNGSTDAAGLLFMPLSLRLQELEQAATTHGTINHALRFTLNPGYCARANIWPATSFATNGGTVPYGARFRLKAGYDISSFSPIAQILLTQLKQYGIILADGGPGWQITTEYTLWPSAYQSALAEVAAAALNPSNFEAVDESGLQISPTSGATKKSETVVATSTVNSAQTAKQQVVLTGITVGLPKDELHIQAGSAPQRFTAFAHGPSSAGVTWSMSPAVGSLTGDGYYTPPATASATKVTVVTATSVSDPRVAAQMTVSVLPNGIIRIIDGQSEPFTDSSGAVWQARTGDDSSHGPNDNGGSWPSSPDIQLYKVANMSYNDMRFDLIVPNGSYSITGKFAETENVAAGYRLMNLETQGQVTHRNVDILSAAGGINKPIDFTLPATVTNGSLSFVVRHVAGDFAIISALQIVPMSQSSVQPKAPPPAPTGLAIVEVK